jgi:hypothetical protein
MPYIKQDERKRYDKHIDGLISALTDNPSRTQPWTSGELNYIISRLIWQLFDKDKKYQRINDIVGSLEGIKLEFYRRKADPYEEIKIKENGDL